jgi:hypothetical protein
MRYSASALLLVVVAVTTTACRQQHTSQNPQQSPPGQDSRLTEQSRPGQGSQLAQGPPENRDSQPVEEPLLLDEEPLLLDEEPPLLLDGGQQESPSSTGPVADNSRCHVCHLNYMEEELALDHARANIGCADCHGDCDEHIADESWASGGNGTPPEIMYPREKINPFCFGCHPKDKIDKMQHEGFFTGTAEEKYCTDCHGEHRLAERKCKWR